MPNPVDGSQISHLYQYDIDVTTATNTTILSNIFNGVFNSLNNDTAEIIGTSTVTSTDYRSFAFTYQCN